MELSGTSTIEGVEISWAGRSDVGFHRALNEDAMVVAPPLFVVADGMGGHDAGEVASALVAERFRGLGTGEPTSMEAVSDELHLVNSLLRDAAGSGSSVMGTTGVGLAVVENGGRLNWLVFNVGDSRAYALTRGDFVQVSRDHSFVQELVDAGEINRAEATIHPHRNVVTRALGADERVRPDFWIRPITAPERFLLCSDGLSGELDDAVLSVVMASNLPAAETVATLVQLALEAGGRDNITALVVDVLDAPHLDDASTGRNSLNRAQAMASLPDFGAVDARGPDEITHDPAESAKDGKNSPDTAEAGPHRRSEKTKSKAKSKSKAPVAAGSEVISSVPVGEGEGNEIDVGPAAGQTISEVPIAPASENGRADEADQVPMIASMPVGLEPSSKPSTRAKRTAGKVDLDALESFKRGKPGNGG